jgi:hypothetical protein
MGLPNHSRQPMPGDRLGFRRTSAARHGCVLRLGIVHAMRFIPLILVLLVGCAHDDPRLPGTWHSNREATVAAAFQRDARWTNAPPERVERFRDLFGHLSITYSNRVATTDFRGKVETFRYRVVRRGDDFVVLDGPLGEYRIRFVDGGRSYWVDSGFGIEERFDRVQSR